MSTPEGQIVKACLQYLKLRGVLAWRQNTGAVTGMHKGKRRFVRFGIPGMSDIAGVLPSGLALFIECKVPGRKPTAAQWAFLGAVEMTGAVTLVVHSLDELIEQLDVTLCPQS